MYLVSEGSTNEYVSYPHFKQVLSEFSISPLLHKRELNLKENEAFFYKKVDDLSTYALP